MDKAIGNSMKAVHFKGDARIDGQPMVLKDCPYNLIDNSILQTMDDSYIRVDLDAVKRLTMNVNSIAKVSKEDKHYKIFLEEGKLFFAITEALSKEETMEFEDSIVQFAIHGTMGVFSKLNDSASEVLILEGEVQGTAGVDNTPFTVKAGELATIVSDNQGHAYVTVRDYVNSDIDTFVQNEVGQSKILRDKLMKNGRRLVNRYVTDSDEISEELYAKMDQRLRADFITKAVSWDNVEKVKDITLVNNYLLISKDAGDNIYGDPDNVFYYIYRVTYTNDELGIDSYEYYWYGAFSGLMALTDGSSTVALSNYECPEDYMAGINLHENDECFLVGTVDGGTDYFLAGFKELDTFVERKITPKLDRYNCETLGNAYSK